MPTSSAEVSSLLIPTAPFDYRSVRCKGEPIPFPASTTGPAQARQCVYARATGPPCSSVMSGYRSCLFSEQGAVCKKSYYLGTAMPWWDPGP